MSIKEYRFFGQVQEVNDIGETTDAGWSVFCTWVKQEDYARLQAEVERLRKAGDAVALDYAERIEIEAGETAKTLMKTLPVLREWNAAKEGKQS